MDHLPLLIVADITKQLEIDRIKDTNLNKIHLIEESQNSIKSSIKYK